MAALEFVDNAKKRTREQMDAWKLFRHEREMVDRFIRISLPRHRHHADQNGLRRTAQAGRDQKRVKVGLAPILFT
jgi:hypothetical protein